MYSGSGHSLHSRGTQGPSPSSSSESEGEQEDEDEESEATIESSSSADSEVFSLFIAKCCLPFKNGNIDTVIKNTYVS